MARATRWTYCGWRRRGRFRLNKIVHLPANVPPLVVEDHTLMKRDSREFIRSTTTLLDHVLTKLTQDEQRELLEALSVEISQRLDARAEMMEA